MVTGLARRSLDASGFSQREKLYHGWKSSRGED
jgi:hypothetical protein